MSNPDTPAKYRWSLLRPVIEFAAWVIMAVVASGAALVIAVMVDIDCNGLWDDHPDPACSSRKSWMAVAPIAVFAVLVTARVTRYRRRRSIARRGVLDGGR